MSSVHYCWLSYFHLQSAVIQGGRFKALHFQDLSQAGDNPTLKSPQHKSLTAVIHKLKGIPREDNPTLKSPRHKSLTVVIHGLKDTPKWRQSEVSTAQEYYWSHSLVKRRPKGRRKLAWKRPKYANISICRLCMVVPLTFKQQRWLYASLMLGHSSLKDRKRLAHDVLYMHTSSTRARFVYDLTNFVKMAASTAVLLRLSNVEF